VIDHDVETLPDIHFPLANELKGRQRYWVLDAFRLTICRLACGGNDWGVASLRGKCGGRREVCTGQMGPVSQRQEEEVRPDDGEEAIRSRDDED